MMGGGGTSQINPSGVTVVYIAGNKYNDLSNDGAWQQGTELPLQGWTTQLYSCNTSTCTSSTQVAKATTDATAAYEFGNLTSGNWYYLCEALSGWGRTQPSGTSNCYSAFQVSSTTTYHYFGNRQTSITAHKFNGRNGNGVLAIENSELRIESHGRWAVAECEWNIVRLYDCMRVHVEGALMSYEERG